MKRSSSKSLKMQLAVLLFTGATLAAVAPSANAQDLGEPFTNNDPIPAQTPEPGSLVFGTTALIAGIGFAVRKRKPHQPIL